MSLISDLLNSRADHAMPLSSIDVELEGEDATHIYECRPRKLRRRLASSTSAPSMEHFPSTPGASYKPRPTTTKRPRD